MEFGNLAMWNLTCINTYYIKHAFLILPQPPLINMEAFVDITITTLKTYILEKQSTITFFTIRDNQMLNVEVYKYL